jgi:Zn-dependent M28 family amino/carboxypeptidase
LLTLLERWMAREPTGVRVRLLFPACEELGYLGARVWVRDHGVDGIAGVLSLELPGVGDSLVVWDAAVETPFLGTVRRAFEEIDLRLDEGYHVVGRIPVFGSDHRAFADVGVPAYGLTTVPAHEVPALRQFIFSPLRSMFRGGGRRPPPFDTYHTPRDNGATLDATALDRMVSALTAVVETLR